VTPFAAEKTLTKDTVPVNVDAVLFWVIWDAQKAALEVKDYHLTFVRNSGGSQIEPPGISPENHGFPKNASNFVKQTAISAA
jgi:hypothetical protein